MDRAIIYWLYLLCLTLRGNCVLREETHVTHYVPMFGGVNCQGDCTITASGEKVIYGRSAACGMDIPHGTRVFISGVGWRTCTDKGGAIDNDEVDIAVHVDECQFVFFKRIDGQIVRMESTVPDVWRFCAHWTAGERDVLWMLPPDLSVSNNTPIDGHDASRKCPDGNEEFCDLISSEVAKVNAERTHDPDDYRHESSPYSLR